MYIVDEKKHIKMSENLENFHSPKLCAIINFAQSTDDAIKTIFSGHYSNSIPNKII